MNLGHNRVVRLSIRRTVTCRGDAKRLIPCAVSDAAQQVFSYSCTLPPTELHHRQKGLLHLSSGVLAILRNTGVLYVISSVHATVSRQLNDFSSTTVRYSSTVPQPAFVDCKEPYPAWHAGQNRIQAGELEPVYVFVNNPAFFRRTLNLRRKWLALILWSLRDHAARKGYLTPVWYRDHGGDFEPMPCPADTAKQPRLFAKAPQSQTAVPPPVTKHTLWKAVSAGLGIKSMQQERADSLQDHFSFRTAVPSRIFNNHWTHLIYWLLSALCCAEPAELAGKMVLKHG